jgi:hypothetical protein
MIAYIYSILTDAVRAISGTFFANPPPPAIKKKKAAIPKKIRTEVWKKYHGDSFIGCCYACGCKLNFAESWHCSHVIAESKGGLIEIDNLRTGCQHCNLSMGNMNLYSYIVENNLKGPGKRHANKYFKNNPSQIGDIRTTTKKIIK